jgi:hypothetical protein
MVSSFAATFPTDRVRATCPRLLEVSSKVLLRVLGPGACSFLVLRATDPQTQAERLVWCLNHSVTIEGDFPANASAHSVWRLRATRRCVVVRTPISLR